MAKKTKTALPPHFTKFVKLFDDAKIADLAAQQAENELKTRLHEGPLESQQSICMLYELTLQLRLEEAKNVKAFFEERTYLAYDPTGKRPNGIPKDIPFGKPAVENYAIPASKLAMPNRDKGWLTKAAALVAYGVSKNMSEGQFRDWLGGEHKDKEGKVLGRGINPAYEAHCKKTAKATSGRPTGNSVASAPAAVDQTVLREAQQKAFRFGKVQSSLKFNVPASIRGKGVFMLLVREDEHGVTSVVPMALDEQKALEAFNAVDRHFEQNPGDKSWDVSVSAKSAGNRIAKAANTPTSRKKVA
ncbi:MAG TPA: hypothetical protein VN155_16710 [Devosia sp.]|nr:hypothetical protein [Devosia sp.]